MPESLKPLLFGYLHLRVTSGPGAGDAGRRLLASFAAREGFALVDVFIDVDESRPQAALAALLRYVRAADVYLDGIAIVVPSLRHLGADRVSRRRTRSWIEREAGVRLLVIEGRS